MQGWNFCHTYFKTHKRDIFFATAERLNIKDWDLIFSCFDYKPHAYSSEISNCFHVMGAFFFFCQAVVPIQKENCGKYRRKN